MRRRRWAVLIPLSLLLAAVIYSDGDRHPTEAAAHQCLRIYADELPGDVRVGHVAQDGRDLVVRVHHLGWIGEIRCVLYRDGSLDDVETLNRNLEVLWSEPPMPSSP